MQRKLIIILLSILIVFIAIIVACNVLVIHVSEGKCYENIDSIPHSTFGILLGTGRSTDPSPYYDARVQAVAELYKAGKIDYIVVSGEHLYSDYNEVDSMLSALGKAGIPVTAIDYYGKNTYASLCSFGDVFGYSSSLTVISQHFHNQRAVFYGALLFDDTPIAYNAQDTDIWYWNIWRFVRESLARTKAVLFLPYYVSR